MILWLFVWAIVASIVVGLAVAGLHALANRERSSMDTAPEPDPVRHTEAERDALWAELREVQPEPISRRERREAEAARRRALIVARQTTDDVAALNRAERDLLDGLERLWAQVCTELGQDTLDAEWAALCTGERLAVAA